MVISENVLSGYPLDGYRVVDLSSGIAGGYSTKVLRDAGADVVKIETPAGDDLRNYFGPDNPVRAGEDGALFRYLAAGKRSVVLDPGQSKDIRFAKDLVAGADAVVWSQGSALADLSALDPQHLVALAPRATVVSITPFGLTGSWSDRPSTEGTRQAWSGGLGQRGDPASPPVMAGARLGEWTTGIFAAAALLASRYRTLNTGKGELLDVSMLETVAYTTTMYPVTHYDVVGEPRYPVRVANLPDIHPTKDGFVGFMVVTGQQWLDFATMVEHPEWIDEPSLMLQKVRSGRRPEFMAAINAWSEQRTLEEAVELASLFRIPVGAVSDGSSVIDLVGADMFVRNEESGFVQPKPPYNLGGSARLRGPAAAPGLGEHTEEERLRAPSTPRTDLATSTSSTSSDPLPFEGLRVVDFTAYWAGPIVGLFLAELGAEVIHVESAVHPDAQRMNTSKRMDEDEWWEWSAVWSGSNTNKRDLALDLSQEEGRKLARRLIAHSDVVVENYSPRVMDNWSFGYEELKAVKEDIIMMRMPAFGLSGPLRDRVGYAQTLEQVSGLSFVSGFEDAPATLNGVCDPLAGTHATVGLLLALEHRRRTGEGMLIEAPMLGGALNVAAEQVLHYSAYGDVLQRRGARSWTGAFQGIYLSADVDEAGVQDRWVVISAETDEQWQSLVASLGAPLWASREKLSTVQGRQACYGEIDVELSEWCRERNSKSIVDLLWPTGVPVGVVVLPHEQPTVPQLDERQFLEPVEHPLMGWSRYPAYPVKFSNGPEKFNRRHSPLLGQDNDYILGDLLQLTTEEIERSMRRA